MNEQKSCLRKILIADDEPKILNELELILCPEKHDIAELLTLESQLFGIKETRVDQPPKYVVVAVRQGDEAVEQVRLAVEKGEPFQAAFLDVRMPPGLDGVCTAEQIRRLDPDIEFVIMTGYSDYDVSEISKRVQPEDKLLYLQKPIHSQEVRQFAYALTSKWLTAKKLQERTIELEQANQQLKELDRLKSEFVLTVSHELRTPLTIFKNILSNAMAGVAGKLPPKLRSNLEMADQAISRMTGIISDFLDISKLDVGKMKIRPATMSVQLFVDKVADMLRFVTDGKGIALDLNMPRRRVAVTIDYEKMAQVLTNLIDNAVKFVPEQNGRIEVLVEDRVETVRVHIRDNGPGIPENEKERIFDRYAQVEGNLKPGKYGTGLGLAICKELVNLHGGRIWVENSPSGGADFVFSLPKAQEGKTADLPAIAAGV
jgi:signal transduction histidine kinase